MIINIISIKSTKKNHLLLKISFLILLFCNIFSIKNYKNEKEIINIAVVGSGFSGSSVSYFLLKEFERLKDTHHLNITIFEKKNNLTDNNLRSEEIQEQVIEVGIPFVFDWQINLKKLLKEFSMNLIKFNATESIGIFNKQEFLVEEKNKDFMDKLKIQYPQDMQILISLIKKFHKALQGTLSKSENKLIFENLESFIETFKEDFSDYKDLDLERADEYLNNLEMKLSFIDKIISAILNSNLNQGTETTILSSLLTILSQLNNKYSVEEGIYKLLNHMTIGSHNYQRNLFVKYNCEVKYVIPEESYKRNPNPNPNSSKKKYTLEYKEEGNNFSTTSETFDFVILNNRIVLKGGFEIKDSSISKDIMKNLIRSEIEYKMIYNHIFIGNLQSEFFLNKTIDKEENIEEFYTNNDKYSSELILINNNQGLKEFNMITPFCKHCFINRKFESNNLAFNSMFRISSSLDRLHLLYNENLFDGHYYYENQTGFGRRRFKNEVLFNNPKGREKKPSIVISKGLYNNRAFDFIDENLEFKVISSKNIASLIVKNYLKEDDLGLISIDF
jgi:hypothetical protein